MIGNRFIYLAGIALLDLGLATLQAAERASEILAPIEVLADRRTGGESGSSLAQWTRDDLRKSAPRTIDELLASEPSFSLYRRQSSIFGNPTSAGVSLRNTGATAASRTLVLLDGIPQNDPFGGWVYWARYDPATLGSIQIVPSSRSAAWGNQSPAGVIQMNGLPPFGDRHVLRAGGGGQGTVSGSTVHQMTNQDKTRMVEFSTFGLHTEGFYAVDASQRGPIDQKLETDVSGGDFKVAWLTASGLTIEPKVSFYQENRNNGTPLTENSTDALDLSLRVSSRPGELTWQASAWHQRRSFQSIFSSVNADRTRETLALNQFDVPGRGTGGAWTLLWDRETSWKFGAGTDVRILTGETNEDVGIFRRRQAGGEQTVAGVFGTAAYQPNKLDQFHASLRLDGWQLTDGHRTETSLASGLPLKHEEPSNRDGLEPSASVEWRRKALDELDGWISAGSTFRLPTLNELYRPFRVRNDTIEASPTLSPERFFTIESGVDWEPTTSVKVGASIFHHWIKDAIANVPVTNPSDIAEIFGTIPAGGTGAQRRNVDRAGVTGIEGLVTWLPTDALTLSLTGIWSETQFNDSSYQPLLEGNPFPQAPNLRMIANGTLKLTEQVSCFAGCEYGAAQFDDALATREIPDFTSARIGASWRIGHAIYQIRIENLLNTAIQTGLSGDGIRTMAAPRSLWIAADWEF